MKREEKPKIVMPEDHMDRLYNSKNRFVRFVHNNRLENIIKKLSNQKGKKILDAGCGEGHLIYKMWEVLNNQYYGIDITPVAVKNAKIRCPFADIKEGDMLKMGYANNFFDIIICTEVLEHIPEFKLVLKEFKRILRPGGLLIVSFPNEVWWTVSRFVLKRKPVRVPDHFNSFSPNKLRMFVGMDFVSVNGLPFNLPFFFSLGCIVVFKNNENEN